MEAKTIEDRIMIDDYNPTPLTDDEITEVLRYGHAAKVSQPGGPHGTYDVIDRLLATIAALQAELAAVKNSQAIENTAPANAADAPVDRPRSVFGQLWKPPVSQPGPDAAEVARGWLRERYNLDGNEMAYGYSCKGDAESLATLLTSFAAAHREGE